MAELNVQTVRLRRTDTGTPWGFRLQGQFYFLINSVIDEMITRNIYLFVRDFNTSRGRKMMSVCVPFCTFHDEITFVRIGLEGWNLLQSVHNGKLLLGRIRHDCQIIILACIIVIFNIV